MCELCKYLIVKCKFLEKAMC